MPDSGLFSYIQMYLEFLTISLLLFIGVFALLKYFYFRERLLLYIGLGSLIVAALDSYYAVDTNTPIDLFPIWNWTISRFFLILGGLASWVVWQKMNDDANSRAETVKDKLMFRLQLSEKARYGLEKFRLTVENVSDHIVITDADGKVLYTNRAVERITGYSRAEVLGKTPALWGKQMDQGFYEYMWKTIKIDKLPFSGEVTNKKKSGQQYFAELYVAPIINKEGNVLFFVGVERDITRAKEIDRMKTEFISLASHQLRTPLSAMKWFLEMLLNGDMGDLATEQKRTIVSIDQSNERMIELVNALLNVSRIESGRIIIDPVPTDLGELVQSVVDEIKVKFEEKKQTPIISIHKNLPKINIDPKLIRHVYMNLLTNAIKYTPEEGEIQVFVSKKGDEIISQVSDNGYGIPKEGHHKVFDKFYRGQNIVKIETEGTGLGLYLAKAVITSSGGKIWFESEEGRGTTFWFSLPLTGSPSKTGEVSLT